MESNILARAEACEMIRSIGQTPMVQLHRITAHPGFRVKLVMPGNVSVERKRIMKPRIRH